MDESYYIYDPEHERWYSHTNYAEEQKRAVFSSDVEAYAFTSPERAQRTLVSLPCTELHLQVIDEYGDIYYDREANYPQNDFLWSDPDDDYEPDYFEEIDQ